MHYKPPSFGFHCAAYLFVSRNENGSPQKTLMAASGDVPPPTEAVPDMEAVDGLVMTLDGATVQGQQRTLAETLDDLSYRTLVFGFPLLTIGIISGAHHFGASFRIPLLMRHCEMHIC